MVKPLRIAIDMFSGIIEQTGRVRSIERDGDNVHFMIEAAMTPDLKIDQSVAHNGACLTVVGFENNSYRVTAILETMQRTNLGKLMVGDEVNLERCMRLNDRLDGHIVQGHVDTVAVCVGVDDLNGSWKFSFEYEKGPDWITVPKGSICVNGVSLTVVDSGITSFSVCIIPYTYEHTNFKHLKLGDTVNLEFDVVGKYVMKYLSFTNHLHSHNKQ
jgi:riboflavin synthase